MTEEVYWISLGDKPNGGGTYAQSVIHHPRWRDSAMQDDFVSALIEIRVDVKKGYVSATLEKNMNRT